MLFIYYNAGPYLVPFTTTLIEHRIHVIKLEKQQQSKREFMGNSGEI